ncbi:fumarylacetoacetate hydrolase family protein [Steroidobacter flavus]|uniref:Fumarylacetoacetate hydrolase family protein n=1 Tax=Steroidobacter flavus TaxID=1842136 RepID=A0ABV8T5Y3_9GAMM
MNVRCGFPPFRLSGVVYGTLMNHRSAVAALGERASAAPYKAPPKAPVLYIKPRNTLAESGSEVLVPEDSPELEVGACLGLVIGRPASHVSLENALDHVGGYLLVADISVPHDTFYRPSIRLKARDGFCPLAPAATPRAAIDNPNALTIRTFVDGALQQSADTSDVVRSVEQLLVDVTEFMTLAPGDVLATGVAAGAPRVRAGQSVRIEAAGLETLSCSFVRRT